MHGFDLTHSWTLRFPRNSLNLDLEHEAALQLAEAIVMLGADPKSADASGGALRGSDFGLRVTSRRGAGESFDVAEQREANVVDHFREGGFLGTIIATTTQAAAPEGRGGQVTVEVFDAC